MDSWQQRTPGTWMLYQFTHPGRNGQCENIGEFPSFRAAVEAARRLEKISKLKGGFSASFCRSHKREGAAVDGFTQAITLEGPAEYDPDVELRLRDGRVMWLSDFEDEAREAFVKVAALEQLRADEVALEEHRHDGPPDPHGLRLEIHNGMINLQCDDCPYWEEIQQLPSVADLRAFEIAHQAQRR